MSQRHIPPSRRRYLAANPTVSARISGELFRALADIAETEGMTLAAVIKEALSAHVGWVFSAAAPDEEEPVTGKAVRDPYLDGVP